MPGAQSIERLRVRDRDVPERARPAESRHDRIQLQGELIVARLGAHQRGRRIRASLLGNRRRLIMRASVPRKAVPPELGFIGAERGR